MVENKEQEFLPLLLCHFHTLEGPLLHGETKCLNMEELLNKSIAYFPTILVENSFSG